MLDDQKKSKNESSDSLKDAPMPPLPFEKHIIGKEDVHSGDYTPDEMIKIVQDMMKKNDEIYRELEDVLQQIGMTPRSLEAYYKDPNNYNPEEMEQLQKEREEMRQSLNIPELPPEPPKASYSKAKTGERPKSKLGASRRKWLPMR